VHSGNPPHPVAQNSGCTYILAGREFRLRFPGDNELTGHYGVSRHTVREAVRRLQDEGVVERGRGRGTFVKDGANGLR
jgi:Bacterial regulatory proteins, gntR family